MITTARSIASHVALIRAFLAYIAGDSYRVVCVGCGADMIAEGLIPRVRIDGYLDLERYDSFEPDHTIICPRCDNVCELRSKDD